MLLSVKIIYFNALCVTGLGSMCFGLLRKIESSMVQQKDASLRTNHAGLKFPYPIKSRFEGIMLKFPGFLLDALNTFIEQLDKKS